MTDFADLIASFQREVAIPGTFATAYPATTDPDISAYLMDAFAQAQLDGFFPTSVIDADAGTVTPDLSGAGAALVVIYAGMRLVRTELRSQSNQRYKAGPVEYETSRSSGVLQQLLKDMTERRDALLQAARVGATLDVVMDAVYGRSTAALSTFWAAGSMWWLPTELPMFSGGWR